MTDPMRSLSIALADRYAIERQIGVGGMATVYLARDSEMVVIQNWTEEVRRRGAAGK